MIGRFFELAAHKTDVRTELIGGITTFLAMAYLFAGRFNQRYVWL